MCSHVPALRSVGILYLEIINELLFLHFKNMFQVLLDQQEPGGKSTSSNKEPRNAKDERSIAYH